MPFLTVNASAWVVGAAALTPSCRASAEASLRSRMQDAFAESQDVVPVRTGALKASGTLTEQRHGLDLVFDITYGGGDVDYAGWVEIFEPYLEPSITGSLSSYSPDGDLEMVR